MDIPFDKLYLVNKENRELIPRIFNYALVLPLSDDILKALYKLRPKILNRKHQYRNDDHKNIPLMINDEQIDGRKQSLDQVNQWWEELNVELNFTNRLVVVPILTSIARKKIRPRYLASKKWFSTQNRRQKEYKTKNKGEPLPAISEFAYLATPRPAPLDKIRPICTICPRMLLHLQGECIPGQEICYKSLNFNDMTEPETSEEVVNASVQSDSD